VTAPALEINGVGKLYGRTAALRGVSLRLGCGQTLALLGPNGSGKTTLLRIIAGATSPTAGSGFIFGRDMVAERLDLRSEIGFMSGDSYLYDDLTANENLRFVMTVAGRKPRVADIDDVLRQVVLRPHADERVRTFSSGMRRRLSLARTLLLNPRLWLLDEPYNSLDEAGAELVDEIVLRVKRGGGAAVIATHDVERAIRLADLVARLENGALVHAGPPTGQLVRHVEHVG
jgi:heme ABC exporter ATP-binding subunit CcmA